MAERRQFLYTGQSALDCLTNHKSRLSSSNFDSLKTEQWYVDYVAKFDELDTEMRTLNGSAPTDAEGSRELYLEHLTALHGLITLCERNYKKFPTSDIGLAYQYLKELTYIFEQPHDEHHDRHSLFGGKLIRSN